MASAISKVHKQPTYHYFFSHSTVSDALLKQNVASHTIEHASLFPANGNYRPSSDDIALKRTMVAYWTTMARNGNPNKAGQPYWPALTATEDAYLDIGSTPSAKLDKDKANCDFWDGITFRSPHL